MNDAKDSEQPGDGIKYHQQALDLLQACGMILDPDNPIGVGNTAPLRNLIYQLEDRERLALEVEQYQDAAAEMQKALDIAVGKAANERTQREAWQQRYIATRRKLGYAISQSEGDKLDKADELGDYIIDQARIASDALMRLSNAMTARAIALEGADDDR